MAKSQFVWYNGYMDKIKRTVFDVANQRIRESPVLLIQGPRSVGKSTLIKDLAKQHGNKVIDFDMQSVVKFAKENLSTLFTDAKTTFIYEYQKVPEVLDEIKVRMNESSKYGQFVISGSTSFDALPTGTQSLTGRLDRVDILPFSQNEINKTPDNNFLRQIIKNTEEVVDIYNSGGISKNNRNTYLQKAAIGGFPLSVSSANSEARSRWFDNYIEHSINNDIKGIAKIRQLGEMEMLINRLAKTNGSVLNVSRIAEDVGINKNTALSYILLLEKIFMIKRLPVNKAVTNSRVIKTPKVHFVDTGIASSLLGLSEEDITSTKPEVLANTGHIYETFAVNEVIKLANTIHSVKRVGYWRTRDNIEIDLILELRDGSVIAIEIKSSDVLRDKDFAPIRHYQQLAGDRFKCGIILYSGIGATEHSNKMITLPLDCLWT
jgi:predicted AAA+ superfamily ATPase